MLTSDGAVRGTGGLNGRSVYLIVTKSRSLVVAGRSVTAGASGVLVPADLGARGILKRYGDVVVAKLGNRLLCTYAADRTLLTGGTSGGGTGGGSGRHVDLVVAGSGYSLLRYVNLLTAGALLTLGLAVLKAGGVDRGEDDLRVAERVNGCVGIGISASTNVDGIAVSCAGRSNYGVGIGVTGSGYNGLRNEYLQTLGALLSLGKTGLGAGGGDSTKGGDSPLAVIVSQ